jgi:hypothetical protein
MIQWEYKEVAGSAWSGKLCLAELNELGKQGWELVSAPGFFERIWYFKRLKNIT